MKKVLLASASLEYVEALLDYVQGSEYSAKFQVTAFSQPEAMSRYMEVLIPTSLPDLVVGEELFVEKWLTGPYAEKVPALIFTEQSFVEESPSKIMKYQPLPVILAKWEERLISSRRRERGGFSGEQTWVIGVTSASGGCGKTTVALNLAKQLGRSGYSVFYLNLETIDSTGPFLHTASSVMKSESADSFSQLLYQLRAKKASGSVFHGEKDEALDIRPYTMRNERILADCFVPARNRKELLQMSKSDTSELIKQIAGLGQYHFIIADHDSVWDPRSEAVMEESGLLVWLLSDDLHTMNKCKEWMKFHEQTDPEKYANIVGKTLYLINRYTGSLVNELPGGGVIAEHYLPYIPSWKQMREPDLLLSSPIYQKEMGKLCEALGVLNRENIG
ncbi:ParA family protein [Paenibacillus sp. Marseille-Q4541]|uniref:nucleotide-binding protein n=1 Tax=Paenibacillus sp. Marseille-Q4541 TaxID=2831522 RepID=UPI001BA5CBBA|nr:ParA family protein [Paenibacillus sp. Marseille-Q4541]